ncbi:MAG: hypothetical protein ABL999_15875 [Pyrinomonadaceae bacterium]
MTAKISSSFLIIIVFVMVIAAFYNAKATSHMVAIETNPTPTPEKKIVNENEQKTPAGTTPISSQASASGVSVAVRDLPTVTQKVSQEPREINPQNTIPIKTIKTQTNSEAVPVKPPSKKKPARRTKSVIKPIR